MSYILLSIIVAAYALYRWLICGVRCKLTTRLDGQVVVITGCNTGIGFETAGQLALRGAKIIMACRDLDKCVGARSRLLERYSQVNLDKWCGTLPECESKILTPIAPEQLVCERLDLASANSVKLFASRVLNAHPSGINILINNAGIWADRRPLYPGSSLEKNMAVNHLGHFLLTKLLLPGLQRIPEEKQRRIINVSSVSYLRGHICVKWGLNSGPFWSSAYSRSKLANVVHALELSRRYPINKNGKGVIAVSLHPGFVYTKIFSAPGFIYRITALLARFNAMTPLQGAQTTLHCALSPDIVSGGYYYNCHIASLTSHALNAETGKYLWKASEEMIHHIPEELPFEHVKYTR